MPPVGQAGGGGGIGPKKNSTLAVVSLVTGILSIIPCCNFYIMSIAAIVTGLLAKKEIKEKPDQLSGGGMATAGIVMGAIGFVISVIMLILQLTSSVLSSVL